MDEYLKLQIAKLNKQLELQEKSIRILESNYKQMLLILKNINEAYEKEETLNTEKEGVVVTFPDSQTKGRR